MDILLAIILLFVAFKYKSLAKWRTYHTTLLYVAMLNLLYLFLCHDHLLWELQSHFLNDTWDTALNTFVILPLVALVFLGHFPFKQAFRRQSIFISKWVLGSAIVEYPFVKFNNLLFFNNWSYFTDVLFYILMFIMIKLHHVRPIFTYILSIITIVVLINLYHVQTP